jgi:hypothetical protein
VDHGGALFFEGVDFGPHDELAAAEDLGEGGGEFSFEGEILGVDVEERDIHGGDGVWGRDQERVLKES